MNMIRHNHVAPNRNIKFALRAMSVLLKSKLGAIHRGNTSAVASRKSDEVEWLIDVIRSSRCGRSLIILPTVEAAVSAATIWIPQAARLPPQTGLVKRDAIPESHSAAKSTLSAAAETSRAQGHQAPHRQRLPAQELRCHTAGCCR